MVDACLSRHFYCIDQNRTKMATFFATPSPPSTLHFLRSSPLRFPVILSQSRSPVLSYVDFCLLLSLISRCSVVCGVDLLGGRS
nr:uncharacterized protein LOC109161862 isoform X1 [Ipomoea trifida]